MNDETEFVANNTHCHSESSEKHINMLLCCSLKIFTTYVEFYDRDESSFE